MKKVVYVLLGLFVLIHIFSLILVAMSSHGNLSRFSPSALGTIAFTVLNQDPHIIIHSPEDIVYVVEYNNKSIYVLDLNVSSNFGADLWSYELQDLGHDLLYAPVGFVQNSTVNATRWSNLLTVYAENTVSGISAQESVEFFVDAGNHAPLLGNVSSEFLVCEGDRFDDVRYNATDIDENLLSLYMQEPSSPFFSHSSDTINEITEGYLGFAGETYAENVFFLGTPDRNITKSEVGSHERVLLALDDEDVQMGDSKNVLIDVIEINNVPELVLGEQESVFTVWAFGDNRTFVSYANVYDRECDAYSGVWCDYDYSLTFKDGVLPFFDIVDLGYGFMEFEADESYLGPNNSSVAYNLTLCANDTGLPVPHPNITLCGQDGSSWEECFDFQLVVTAENRAPIILSNHPEDLEFGAGGESEIYFNLSSRDPDGNFVDNYWYVDGELVQYTPLSSYDEFIHSFPCGVGGIHTVEGIVSDGELNSSVVWNVNVVATICPGQNNGGGGGGGGGGGLPACEETWACNPWFNCINVSSALGLGMISGEDYREVVGLCEETGFDMDHCGYHERECFDANVCETFLKRPPIVQACYFTDNPTCDDGIKNCHDGGCEFLVDCGGPCGACATCSDGVQNQGEFGIDCGGPCPRGCVPEVPSGSMFLISLITAVIVLAIIVMFVLFRHVWKLKKSVVKAK